jgi:hypothetical protein
MIPTKNNPPPGPKTVAEEILEAVQMAKAEERSVEIKGLDMKKVKKFLKNMAYTFTELKDGKQIVVNFPQRDEIGKPVPLGVKPKYQISIH